jgi:hypothetical protein
MVVGGYRTFNGQRYKLWNKYTRKTGKNSAQEAARYLRSRGKKARIIKRKRKGVGITDYIVYYRNT